MFYNTLDQWKTRQAPLGLAFLAALCFILFCADLALRFHLGIMCHADGQYDRAWLTVAEQGCDSQDAAGLSAFSWCSMVLLCSLRAQGLEPNVGCRCLLCTENQHVLRSRACVAEVSVQMQDLSLSPGPWQSPSAPSAGSVGSGEPDVETFQSSPSADASTGSPMDGANLEGFQEHNALLEGITVDSSVKSLSGALELADSFLLSGSSSSQEGLNVHSSGQDCPVSEMSTQEPVRKEAVRGSLLRRPCRTQGGLLSTCPETKPNAGTMELQEAATSVLEAADLNASLPACPRSEMDLENSESECERDPAPTPVPTKAQVNETEDVGCEASAPEGPPSEPVFLPVRRRLRGKSTAPRPTCVQDGACDPSFFCSQQDFEDFWNLGCRWVRLEVDGMESAQFATSRRAN